MSYSILHCLAHPDIMLYMLPLFVVEHALCEFVEFHTPHHKGVMSTSDPVLPLTVQLQMPSAFRSCSFLAGQGSLSTAPCSTQRTSSMERCWIWAVLCMMQQRWVCPHLTTQSKA